MLLGRLNSWHIHGPWLRRRACIVYAAHTHAHASEIETISVGNYRCLRWCWARFLICLFVCLLVLHHFQRAKANTGAWYTMRCKPFFLCHRTSLICHELYCRMKLLTQNATMSSQCALPLSAHTSTVKLSIRGNKFWCKIQFTHKFSGSFVALARLRHHSL